MPEVIEIKLAKSHGLRLLRPTKSEAKEVSELGEKVHEFWFLPVANDWGIIDSVLIPKELAQSLNAILDEHGN